MRELSVQMSSFWNVYYRFTVCVHLQVFSYTIKKELMIDELCLETSHRNGPIILQRCHGQGGNQQWHYDQNVSNSLLSMGELFT
jgi:hypothetical protein